LNADTILHRSAPYRERGEPEQASCVCRLGDGVVEQAVANGNAAAANRAALDWLNLLLADVQGGIGPFLAVFLTSSQHWDAGAAGMALTVGGLATVLARPISGALVDVLRAKRALIAAATVTVMVAAAVMAVWPRFWPVMLAQVGNGVADAVFPAAIAAISLGIVGRARFTVRVGRNEAFNHGGNVLTALIAGLAGWAIGPAAVLWLVAVLALLVLLPLTRVRAADIDHVVARGADDGDRDCCEGGGLSVLLRNRPLVAFTAAITLFHFANAAMLPLLGEKLAAGHAQAGAPFIATCIIIAQTVMVPMAILVGSRADAWGRKRLLLVGFAALPVRGVLYTLVQDPAALLAIQALDGVGAGIFGALFPVVVADLTEGTGRYNLAQGAAAACWGLGAALSNAVAGAVVDWQGYDAAFLFLAACAGLALLVLWTTVPESRGWTHRLAGKAGYG
jgi:MFS family permease